MQAGHHAVMVSCPAFLFHVMKEEIKGVFLERTKFCPIFVREKPKIHHQQWQF